VINLDDVDCFFSCLLRTVESKNDEGMSWHSESEKQLKEHSAIALVSLGAEREVFKHKINQQTHGLVLQHGSLLVMKGTTKTHWMHRFPPTRKVNSPRVNLTFRTVITD
tara:strand:- start:1800 stop:2126 length:327 start_codon:yes stop_codon:yes gene_type:complete